MRSDEFAKNTLVPVLLRITLAVIFIYHGLDKIIGPQDEFGANWAEQVWREPTNLPEAVAARLDAMPDETPERVWVIKDKLRQLYAKDLPPMPETLRNHAIQLAVAWGEFIGGVALLIGLLTRLAAAGQMVIQIGAIYIVTWLRGFSFGGGGGYEYNLSLLAMCLALVLLGGGTLSVDYLVRRGRKTAKHAPAAVGSPTPTAS